MGENQSSSIEALKDNFYVYDYNMSLISMTAYYRNVSCIERDSDARIIIRVSKSSLTRLWPTPYFFQTKYSNRDGTPLVHIMKNCLRFYYISYIVRKNYPFSQDFNQVFGRFQEAGLIDKWYQNMLQAMSHYKGDVKESANLEACTFKGLSFYFYMLLLGYGFGGCVLLLELYVFRRKRPRNC